jgi:4-hydroxy-2-oxoheptanedioate aldolase
MPYTAIAVQDPTLLFLQVRLCRRTGGNRVNVEHVRRFRERMGREAVFGPFMKTHDPAFVEAAGYAGFDFVILDLEHGPNSVESLQNLIRAAEISSVVPIVRVKEGVPSTIGEALDVGAAGIQVPQVTTAAEAREAIERIKFSPDGTRGVCRFVRSAGYSSIDRYRYFKESNEAVVILQLEGVKAIENLAEILEVKGIDVVFIGPYDLSQSLGVPGQTDHPRVIGEAKRIVETCLSRGICAGIFVDTIEGCVQWQRLGIRYISYSVDVGLFYESCRSIVETMKGRKDTGARRS